MKLSPLLARRAALLFTLLFLLPLASAQAATVVVTSALDDGSAGTLRSQVAAASDGDTITFNAALFAQPQAILLTQGEISVAKSLSIAGPGASTCTISGGSASRLFNITSGTVSIAGLTLSGGSVVGRRGNNGADGRNRGSSGEAGSEAQGGAILNAGVLALRSVVLNNNNATGGDGGTGGNSNPPRGSQAVTYGGEGGRGGTARGGAIYNSGTLQLSDTLLTGNGAAGGIGGNGGYAYAGLGGLYAAGGRGGDAQGGAIYNSGTLQLFATVLTGNGATGGKAGVGDSVYIGGSNGNNARIMRGGNAIGGAIYSVPRGLQIDGGSSATGNTVMGGTGQTVGTAQYPNIFLEAAPVALSQAVSTREDTAFSITLDASDALVASADLTRTILTQPTQGTLSGSGATRTYTPSANFSGTDSFTFKASNGTLDSDVATISITVTPVNDAPTLSALGALTVPANAGAQSVALQGIGAGGGESQALAVTATSSNTAVVAAPAVSYTSPEAAGRLNFLPVRKGTATITVTVQDDGGTSPGVDTRVRTFVVTVTNIAPVAAPDAAQTNEDTSVLVDVLANDSDTDGDALRLTYVAPEDATHGTLAIEGSKVRYTPEPNFSGASSWRYEVVDGTVAVTGQATVQVLAVNDAPVARSQSQSASEDTPLDITLAASDIEDDALSLSLVTPPAHGTLSGSGAARRYIPAPDYSGPDSFTFRANDGALDSNVATVTITVSATNDTPVAVADAASTDEDTSVLIDVLANDSDTDGDVLTLTSVAPGAGTPGTLAIEGNKIRYTPASNVFGEASFRYTMSDGALSATASVRVTVRPVNDAPVARGQELTLQQNGALALTLAAHDIDGDALAFSVVSAPSHGALQGSGAALTYVPAIGFSGPDSFTFRASDGSAASNVATVTIQVAPAPVTPPTNPDPTPTTPPATTDPTPTTPPATTDPTPTTPNPTPSPTAAPEPGSPSAPPTEPPTAPPTAPGTGQGNRAPVAVADAYSTQIPLQVLAARGVLSNDHDADRQALTALLKSRPAHGTLAWRADGSFTYRPAAGFWGRDAFTYAASDGAAQSAPVTVVLTVLPPHDVIAPAVSITLGAQPLAQRLTRISGVASDPAVVRGVRVHSSGLARVVVHLRRNGLFWNGRSWQSTRFDLRTALAAGARWQLIAALPSRTQAADGPYFWTAVARDKAGNASSITRMVRLDSTAPSLVIETPRAGSDGIARVTALPSASGRAAGAARVEVALRRADGSWWNGRSYQRALSFAPATLGASTWTLTRGLPSGAALTPGRYTLLVRATDAAGNVATVPRELQVASVPAG